MGEKSMVVVEFDDVAVAHRPWCGGLVPRHRVGSNSSMKCPASMKKRRLQSPMTASAGGPVYSPNRRE